MEPDRSRPYYITTPIYYVNGRPHIGSALTTLCCDVLARFQRMRGRRTWFLTGTDEQATKVAEAASEAGVAPSEYVDGLAAEFKAAWADLGIAYDDFIRTTEDRHVRVVQEVFRRLRASGDAYRGVYEGWYCVSDETFFRETDVGEDRLCPNAECRKPLRRVQEENYFFRLSAYADRLVEHIERNPGFLQPEFRRNEVVAFIQQGLRDMSITRANDGWGIPVPDEPDLVIYVWFDALINYLAATGWPDHDEPHRDLWPADAHLMAKEIFVRFHATLWPAMLMALGLPLPRTVYAHGWWVDAEGRKEGKRTGGLPHPSAFTDDLVVLTGASRPLCTDALRYLLLREMVFHGDSEYSREGFLRRYNTDLANDLGNLCNRATSMVDRYFGGAAPEGTPDAAIGALAARCAGDAAGALTEYRFNAALEAVWQLVGRVNRYIEEEAPWALAKRGDTGRLADVLITCLEAVRVCATLVAPVMPSAADELVARVGAPRGARPWLWDDALAWGAIPAGASLPKPEPLFPRIQIASQENNVPSTDPTTPAPVQTAAHSPAPAAETITIDDFMKVELRVADVIAAEPVPSATKLLKLTVSLGDEQRTVLAGIAELYEPAELVGRQVVLVANLQPRKMRGIESQGMILAADADGQPILVTLETPVPPGTRVR
ncbi:MAG TPA: methionine--tRNA ligase [Chthonomonadales bacterium]|nr:methionine--tRNA ligase [Chthonomonadales bacterium]